MTLFSGSLPVRRESISVAVGTAAQFRFGSFLLTPSRFELLYQGRALKCEPRVFELLVYLVVHRQRVVSKGELLANIWRVEYASDAVLTRAVAQARRLLGHEGGGAAYIQTVHGRGYRFVAATEELPLATPEPRSFPPPSPEFPGGPPDAEGKPHPLRWFIRPAAVLLVVLSLVAVLANLAGHPRAPFPELKPCR